MDYGRYQKHTHAWNGTGLLSSLKIIRKGNIFNLCFGGCYTLSRLQTISNSSERNMSIFRCWIGITVTFTRFTPYSLAVFHWDAEFLEISYTPATKLWGGG